MRLTRGAIIVFFAGLLAVLAGCDPYGETKSDNPPTTTTYGPSCPKVAPDPISVAGPVATAEERANCEAAGGTIQRQGLLGSEGCLQPYCDAGQACTDASDCIGRCYSDSDTDFDGGAAVGACQPNNSPFGCRTEIVAGQVGPTLCVD